jgi:hypothetical protein
MPQSLTHRTADVGVRPTIIRMTSHNCLQDRAPGVDRPHPNPAGPLRHIVGRIAVSRVTRWCDVRARMGKTESPVLGKLGQNEC